MPPAPKMELRCSSIQRRIRVLGWAGITSDEEKSWENMECEQELPVNAL